VILSDRLDSRSARLGERLTSFGFQPLSYLHSFRIWLEEGSLGLDSQEGLGRIPLPSLETSLTRHQQQLRRLLDQRLSGLNSSLLSFHRSRFHTEDSALTRSLAKRQSDYRHLM
jgi:hypothetical protein